MHTDLGFTLRRHARVVFAALAAACLWRGRVCAEVAAPGAPALLYLLRGGAAGPDVRLPLLLDGGSELAAPPGGYGGWQIPPGAHELIGKVDNGSRVAFQAEAGRPVYVCQHVTSDAGVVRAELAVITEQSIPACKAVQDLAPVPTGPAVVAFIAAPVPAYPAPAPMPAATLPVAVATSPDDDYGASVEGLRFGAFAGGAVVPGRDVTAVGAGLTLTVGSSQRHAMEPRISAFLYQTENPDTKTTGLLVFGHDTFWFGTYGLGFGGGFGYADFTRIKGYGWTDDSLQVAVYGSPVMLRFGRRPTFEMGLQTGFTRFLSHDDFLPFGLIYFGASI
jgi:hypothetical protein